MHNILIIVILHFKPIKLNTEYFIARTLIRKKAGKSQISQPIVRISLASIIIGMAIMIITVSIVTGFQNKIREKVIGFGSHIQITNMEDNTSMESSPLLVDTSFISGIKNHPDVKHVQRFAYKPGILQSSLDTNIITVGPQVDTAINHDVLGVLFKGIDQDFDWTFFDDKIIEGTPISLKSNQLEVLVSAKIAKLLHYKVGDKLNAFFVLNNTPKKRKFTIKGIYQTGLEEFDKKIIFTNIKHIQDINNWGIQSNLTIKDTCINGYYVLQGLSFGNFPYHKYKWNGVNSDQTLYLIDGHHNQTIHFEASINRSTTPAENDQENHLYDRSTAKIIIDSACGCSDAILAHHPIEYTADTLIKMPFGHIQIENGKSTRSQYTGGYEVLIANWQDLTKMNDIIYSEIPFELKTTKITDLYSEVFSWLNFLDMNIIVILAMMLAVSLINMITSLLVLIIEKTNFIGILKAVGANNWSIRKIFIFNAILLLGKGLFWGNLLGIGFLLIQHFFKIIPLDAEVYYLDHVPVNLNFLNILLINALTIFICFIILILPSYLITKINPIKAIKFN